MKLFDGDLMQNRYVGDVGDFVKLAILRTLSPGRRVGIAWWLHPDEAHNGDGRHTSYLSSPGWRRLDPELFEALKEIVHSGRREVRMLESANLLPGAVYAGDTVPTDGPPRARAAARQAWLHRVVGRLASTDLVFVDPDNGLETTRFSPGARRGAKSVSLQELQALRAPGRTLLVYHHQTRRPGGHNAELTHWGVRLAQAGFSQVDAIRARPYSPRAFFLLDAPPLLRSRAQALCSAWSDVLTWRPDLHHLSAGCGADGCKSSA